MTRFSSKSLEIMYSVAFRTPFFGLARNNVELLQAFYQQLAPKYVFQSSDAQVIPGTTLSNIRAILTLFKGNGTMEICADRFHAKFINVLGPDDRKIVEDCLVRALTALKGFVPESQLGAEMITVHALLVIAGGVTARSQFLDRFRNSYLDTLPKSPNRAISPAIKLDVQNDAENWTVSVELSRAWADPSALFLAVNANFLTGASAQSLPRREQLVGEVLANILSSVGLQSETNVS